MFKWLKKKKQSDEEFLKTYCEKLSNDAEIIKSGRAPRTYVVAREPNTIEDANEIAFDAIQRSKNWILAAGLDTAYASLPEHAPKELWEIPLQQIMMGFIQQIDGGKYLTDEYEFIDYYHPAEGVAPRDNHNKEYYVLTPFQKI